MGGLATANTLGNLASTVSDLSGNVDDLSGDVDDLATADDLTTGLVDLQTQIDALVDALENVADADDITAITEQLNQVQEDLDELLAANAVINQAVKIINVPTLQAVESLIATGTDDPNVIVNGIITVEVDEDDFDAAQLARVNAVIGKIATGLSTVTITNTYSPSTVLNFENLTFVDNDLVINGNTNLADGDTSNDKLRTISGDLTISNVTGDLNLGLLLNANNVTVPTGVTKLLLGSLEANAFSTTGLPSGHLQLLAATQADTGKGTVQNLNAPKATDVDVSASATVTINTPAAATLDIGGTGASYGYVSITCSSTTVARLEKLTTTGTITTNGIAELHLPAMNTVSTFTSDAVVADLTKLATQRGDYDFTLNKLKLFNAPALDVTGNVSVTVATDIDIKDYSPGGVLYGLSATDLTITALADTNSITITGAGVDFPKLTDLSVTGVADAAPSLSSQTNAVSSTSAILENVTVAGTIDRVVISTGTKLASVNTSGYIRWFELRNGGSDLKAATFGHDHIEGSDAATFIAVNNTNLTGITTTELDEVGNVTIQDNPKLSTLDLSSFETLPQLGAYTITISNTALTGNYVQASVLVTTTAARVERIRSAALNSLKPAMTLAAATTAVTYTFAGDLISNVTTSTRSNVNDNIVATSTNTSTLHDLINYPSPVLNAASKVVTTVTEASFPYIEGL